MQKLFFPFLVLFSAGVAAIFSFSLCKEIFFYFPLHQQAVADVLRWEVKEIGDRFAIKVFYTFEAQGKRWEGASFLEKPWYLNEPSAVDALRRKAQHSYFVWFNPKNPIHSSIEKHFPVGLLVRTVFCYGILIYFIVWRGKIKAFVQSG